MIDSYQFNSSEFISITKKYLCEKFCTYSVNKEKTISLGKKSN